MKPLIKKGTFYYETQIIMLVIMWQHDMSHKRSGESNSLLSCGRLYIWYDSAWRFHGTAGNIRFFFYSLTKNADKFKTLKGKFKVISINAKHMFEHWALEIPLVDSLLSLRNYLRLHKAGFRITNSRGIWIRKSKTSPLDTDITRFWWKKDLITNMPDIDCVGDKFYTVYNCRFIELGKKPHSFFNKEYHYIHTNQDNHDI